MSARSVKLLNKIEEPDEPETRDAWWLEIREEIRSHAKCALAVRTPSSTWDRLCVHGIDMMPGKTSPIGKTLQGAGVPGCDWLP